MATLCRDCSRIYESASTDCPNCQSQRSVAHPKLAKLSIAHIDCDAFYAAVEKRDNPELKSLPVIVGGGKRGVVSTCCYIARLYGVRSAMPMFKAMKLCPDAVVVKPDHRKYSAVGGEIRERMKALTPLVQPVSIDEAYLDLSGTETLHARTPAETLSKLATEIEQDLEITISIGLSANKFLAKMASEIDKPRGFAIISPEGAPDVLAPMPIQAIHGVGRKLAEKLGNRGLHLISDLQEMGQKPLIREYGETGHWLYQRAHGIDHRPVEPHSERKSVSSEITFGEDIRNLTMLEDRLWRVSESTARRAKRAGVVGATVSLKLKTAGFRSLTRQITVAEPTQIAQSIFRHARPLLQKIANGSESYRLIGVGLSDLSPFSHDEQDLLDPLIAKRAAAERASDVAKAKFGENAVMTGRAAKDGLNRKNS